MSLTPPRPPRKGSLLRTLRAVAWSLIGLRKGEQFQRDQETLQPLHAPPQSCASFSAIGYPLFRSH